MPENVTFEHVDATLSVQPGRTTMRTSAQNEPFRIMIMGDFSGRSNRKVTTDDRGIAGFKLHLIDRDSYESTMAALAVELHLRLNDHDASSINLTFNRLDDFHPDAIYYGADVFKVLRETREKLSHAETFAETAALLTGKRTQAPQRPATPINKPTQAPDFPKETGGSLLDQIVAAGSSSSAEPYHREPPDQWDQFIAEIVAPHLVPDIEKEQQALIGIIDDTMSQTMSGILHHPDFQHLEAAWRAVHLLVRRLETGMGLSLCLLDVSKVELAGDLTSAEQLEDTGLFRRLSSVSAETSGRKYWGAIICDFTFDKTKADAVTLARLGAIGQHFQAPFIGAAGTLLAGTTSIARSPDPKDWHAKAASEDERAWQVIRKLPEAAWVGLAIPRFLLRLPYGNQTEAVDSFDFEETPDPSEHKHYLWANPAFAVALVLGATFTRHGWAFDKGLQSVIDNLPLYIYRRNGESVALPCAEATLSDLALDSLMSSGIMALVSLHNQDRIRLARLQSLAFPPAALCGRWLQDCL